MSARRDLEASWAWLRGRGFTPPVTAGGEAYLPDRPLVEELPFTGLVVRGLHEEASFDHLTMPRTLFEEAQLHGVSFAGRDLKFSLFLRCSVIDCDFTGCDLLSIEAVQSHFFGCTFANARLIRAELLQSTLEHCTFAGANLTGARLPRALKGALALSDEQRERMVDWRE